MSKLKYKLVRELGFAVVTAGLAASCFNVKLSNSYNTSEEKQYLEELEQLKSDEIIFSNAEFYDYLLKKLKVDVLTRADLNSISFLKIDDQFSNCDFSDFKYLPNLSKVYISNNNVDLNDFYYNADLREVNITNGKVINTRSIPNSVTRINFNKVVVADGLLSVPYYVYNLNLVDTSFNQLYIRNPEKLERITIAGDAFVDLKAIENCSNLNYLSLTKCANVSNGSVLKDLQIEELQLDDYATIWLDKDTATNINFESKNGEILSEIEILDDIIYNLDLEGKTPDEKRREIVSFVISKLQYDEMVDKQSDLSNDLKRFYTNLPVYYAVRFSDSISINYTCLIQALCNRAGLQNYQLFSSTQSWNNINNMNVDPLQYDLTGNNMYLSFNLNSSYQPKMTPAEEEVKITNIGYVNDYETVEIEYNGENLKFKLGAYALAMFLISFAYLYSTRNIYDDDELLEMEMETEKKIEKNRKKRAKQAKRKVINRVPNQVFTASPMSAKQDTKKATKVNITAIHEKRAKVKVKPTQEKTAKPKKEKKINITEKKIIFNQKTKKSRVVKEKHRVVVQRKLVPRKIEKNKSLKLVNRI